MLDGARKATLEFDIEICQLPQMDMIGEWKAVCNAWVFCLSIEYMYLEREVVSGDYLNIVC